MPRDKVWNREEIGKHSETLFILYAKKNAAYVIEGMVQDTKDVVVAVVLWKKRGPRRYGARVDAPHEHYSGSRTLTVDHRFQVTLVIPT